MPHRFPPLASLFTLSLLISCGNSTTTTPTSGAISGVITSAGAIGPSQQLNILAASNASWWADAQLAQQHRAMSGGDIVAGEFLVRLKSTLSAQSLGQLSVAGASLTQVRPIGSSGLYLYRSATLSAQTMTASQITQQSQRVISALNARPEVLYAEPNLRLYALKTSNDAYLPLQWNIPKMNLPAAWDVTTGSAKVVAVVDTGIIKHPDLAGKVLAGADFVSDIPDAGDGNGYDSDPTDLGGDTGYHGSHVAGTVAAATNNGIGIAGVSWGAKILPVRVLGKSGGGTLDDILTGVAWAAGEHVTGVADNPNPAKVINLSLGGAGGCTQSEQALFDDLATKNITVVVAAGNDNVDAGSFSPASCNNVIVVGAVGPDGTRAPYSNYGSKVDVMAPGGDLNQLLTVNGTTYPGGILSTVYDDSTQKYAYGFYQGTSMASPHVAGLAALMLSQTPGLTPAQLKAKLKATASALSSKQCGVTNGCGSGLVDASAALSGSTSTPPPTPTPTPPTPQPAGNIPTYVFAYHQASGGIDPNLSKGLRLTNVLVRTPYTLSGLTPGQYELFAWQDLNSNGKFDSGEPNGFYTQADGITPKLVTVDGVTSEITGVDITLQPFTASKTSASVAKPASPRDALIRALNFTTP